MAAMKSVRPQGRDERHGPLKHLKHEKLGDDSPDGHAGEDGVRHGTPVTPIHLGLGYALVGHQYEQNEEEVSLSSMPRGEYLRPQAEDSPPPVKL
jgi:hypothetical protein